MENPHAVSEVRSVFSLPSPRCFASPFHFPFAFLLYERATSTTSKRWVHRGVWAGCTMWMIHDLSSCLIDRTLIDLELPWDVHSSGNYCCHFRHYSAATSATTLPPPSGCFLLPSFNSYL